MLENDIRRLANNRSSISATALYTGNISRQFPPPPVTPTFAPNSHVGTTTPAPTTASSTTSLNNNFENESPFVRQRPASVDPAMKMEEIRRNIAERRNHRSYSRPRLPSTTTTPPSQAPDSRDGDEKHNRASSGPSSVVYSTSIKSPAGHESKEQSEIERQIAAYMASLPAETRRRFVAATGLNKTDFTNYPVQHSATPSLPEGAKLSLARQGSQRSNASSSSQKHQRQQQQTPPNEESPPAFVENSSHGVRIHLTEPSTDAKLQESPDRDELNSPPSSEDEESTEPDEPQTPASSISSYQRQNNQLYQFEVQPPQSHTQIHTTTVVEVNKEQLSSPHRSHLRTKNQKRLSHQPNSLGADPMMSGGSGGYSNSRFSESPAK